MSDINTNSPFKNSLFYRALKHVLSEIRSPENTYYAGLHFRNDPRDHPGERIIHYVESGRFYEAMSEYRNTHPELRRDFNQPRQAEKEAVAA